MACIGAEVREATIENNDGQIGQTAWRLSAGQVNFNTQSALI